MEHPQFREWVSDTSWGKRAEGGSVAVLFARFDNQVSNVASAPFSNIKELLQSEFEHSPDCLNAGVAVPLVVQVSRSLELSKGWRIEREVDKFATVVDLAKDRPKEVLYFISQDWSHIRAPWPTIPLCPDENRFVKTPQGMADSSRMPSQLLLGFFSITFGSLIAGSFYSPARARRYGELARCAIRVRGLDESGRTLLDKLDRRIENQAKRAETGTNTEARLLFPTSE